MGTQQSTLDRKKKNFTFSRKFPFMKSKDEKNEDGSDQERKSVFVFGETVVIRKFIRFKFFFLHFVCINSHSVTLFIIEI